MAVTPAARPARPPRWPAVLAWTLCALAMLAIPAVAWSDHLLREAGRSGLVQLGLSAAPPVVAIVSASTVGALLASR